MTLLVHTIHIFGSIGKGLRWILVEPQPTYQKRYYTVSESETAIHFRKSAKIFFIAFMLASTVLCIYLVNKIVAHEYAVVTLTNKIQTEAKSYNDLLAEYSELSSHYTLKQVEEQSKEGVFVAIDAIHYIGEDTILQANANIR